MLHMKTYGIDNKPIRLWLSRWMFFSWTFWLDFRSSRNCIDATWHQWTEMAQMLVIQWAILIIAVHAITIHVVEDVLNYNNRFHRRVMVQCIWHRKLIVWFQQKKLFFLLDLCCRPSSSQNLVHRHVPMGESSLRREPHHVYHHMYHHYGPHVHLSIGVSFCFSLLEISQNYERHFECTASPRKSSTKSQSHTSRVSPIPITSIRSRHRRARRFGVWKTTARCYTGNDWIEKLNRFVGTISFRLFDSFVPIRRWSNAIRCRINTKGFDDLVTSTRMKARSVQFACHCLKSKTMFGEWFANFF